jgi:hypothetical protein
MFRTKLYQQVGGYRKVFEPAEDHDFILRILEHCEGHNLYEPLVSYRLNPNGLTVNGHQYIEELRDAAMRLARRRRSGQSEDLESEISLLHQLKRRRKAPGGLAGTWQVRRDSFYAANRYYGLGCRELCAGRLENARRCFLRSLRTNALFAKSWIGAVLSILPFAASRSKFLFRTSMRLNEELKMLRSSLSSREVAAKGKDSRARTANSQTTQPLYG